MRVSLVVTVLNESLTIDSLLESIAQQTRAPDEVVIVDGGSTDGTLLKLHTWTTRLPLRVLQEPGATIARGRNVGIAAAHHDVIAVTDAGVRLEPAWLERLLRRLGEDVDVVGGFFVPEADTVFERAMAATVLPEWRDVRAETFLPSSRSVLFRRSAWQAVDGYPEWLDYCEDVVFDLALRENRLRFAAAPDAVARFRPRGDLAAFFKQYFRYARGDGKADLWRVRHAIRYATYVGLAAALAAFHRTPALVGSLLLFGIVAYTRRPYERLARFLPAMGLLSAAYAVMLVPVIRAVGDTAKMLGYPSGVLWRRRFGRPR